MCFCLYFFMWGYWEKVYFVNYTTSETKVDIKLVIINIRQKNVRHQTKLNKSLTNKITPTRRRNKILKSFQNTLSN